MQIREFGLSQTNGSLSSFSRVMVDFCCQLQKVFWPILAMLRLDCLQLLMLGPFQEFRMLYLSMKTIHLIIVKGFMPNENFCKDIKPCKEISN